MNIIQRRRTNRRPNTTGRRGLVAVIAFALLGLVGGFVANSASATNDTNLDPDVKSVGIVLNRDCDANVVSGVINVVGVHTLDDIIISGPIPDVPAGQAQVTLTGDGLSAAATAAAGAGATWQIASGELSFPVVFTYTDPAEGECDEPVEEDHILLSFTQVCRSDGQVDVTMTGVMRSDDSDGVFVTSTAFGLSNAPYSGAPLTITVASATVISVTWVDQVDDSEGDHNTYDVVAKDCPVELIEVTPQAPTSVDNCGTANDNTSALGQTGVNYVMSGSVASGSVTWTASPVAGYKFPVGAVTSWTFTFTNNPCPVTTIPDTRDPLPETE